MKVIYLCVFSIFTTSALGQIAGFSETAGEAQRQLEREFDRQLNSGEIRDWIRKLSARPHHLGSPYDKENAEYMLDLFRQWGFEAELETFEVLFPTPRVRSLEMLKPTYFKASLVEPALDEDETSSQQEEQLPVYNAYSRDGDVTAEVVYVNYGVPKDYEELERRGISVEGKIVLARYYGSWRGIKPKVAAEKGAIGTLIYSDPKDDGFVKGDVYPTGAYRNEHGAQRGSVMDMPLYPGDPLTPGIGATATAQRLKRDEAVTITKIPVLPISYADALPILRALEGPVAPDSWKGGLPVTYHLGPGPAKVHLRVEFNWDMAIVYDVIARMRGAQFPDEWVIRGNHHDAWVNGARDPVSGMAVVLAEAKALGTLVKAGKRPLRTIVYAAWGAEEQGLIGSTEWVEKHEKELREKAVVYINSDSNSRGFLRAGGSHALESLVTSVGGEVIDPQTRVTVAERERARLAVSGDQDSKKDAERSSLRLSALGSGSDYSPFLQHLGIASLNLGYSGESSGGSYHSIYDSFDHYRRFGDPDFAYGVTLAQTAGRLILRIANAEILPFVFHGFVENVNRYLKEVIQLADTMRRETNELNRQIDDGLFRLALDPRKPDRGPQKKDPVPYIAFASLKNALERVKQAAIDIDKRVSQQDPSSLSIGARQRLNRLLYQFERQLTRPRGLPRRPWYKHYIYAPGFYTGYGVKTLPGVREAIEQRNWKEADDEIRATAEVLNRAAEQLESIAALLVTR